MRVEVLVLVVSLAATGCTTGLGLTLTAAAEEPEPMVVTVAAPVETAPPPTTSTTTTEPPREPVVLGFAGDVNMIRGIEARRPLEAVAGLLSAPDLMMVNLETVIGEPGETGTPPIPKEFIFRSPPETLDQLAEAGVDVVGLANNHAWDYGPLGAMVTSGYVSASDLVGTGVGANSEEAYRPVFVEVDDRTIGVLSLTLVPCDWSADPEAERPEIAYACVRFATTTAQALMDLVDGSDIAVVLVHGSEELADCPSIETRQVVTAWMSLGVDVVSVSHPHVLGGVELMGDGVVLWSTGNFAFVNGGGRTARSAIFEVAVGDEGVRDVTIHPTVLPGGAAAPADEETAALIREEVGDRSSGATVDETGRLVLDRTPSICDRN